MPWPATPTTTPTSAPPYRRYPAWPSVPGAVILGLTHPPKGNADAVTAAIGSTAWTAVARISWVMGVDPSDEAKLRRVVRPAPGSNYRLPDHGLSFLIAEHDESEAGFITGLGESDVAAEDITSPPEPDSPEELSKLDEARDFVRRIMVAVRREQEQGDGCNQAGIEGGPAGERGIQRGRRGAQGTVGAPEWWWEHDVPHLAKHGSTRTLAILARREAPCSTRTFLRRRESGRPSQSGKTPVLRARGQMGNLREERTSDWLPPARLLRSRLLASFQCHYLGLNLAVPYTEVSLGEGVL